MLVMRILERFLLVAGIALLCVYLGMRIRGALSSHVAVMAFRTAQKVTPAPEAKPEGQTVSGVDVSLWSEQRIAAFKRTLSEQFNPAEALLRIPKIHLEVPVFDGTDDEILNRGVGRIIGTARIGADGNIGIAGHRDGYFRGLKDIQAGDTVDLVLRDKTERFVVETIQIVDPDDVSVLKPGPVASLTLVTCYPFYFIGSAPKRYIVRASLTGDRPSNVDAVTKQSVAEP
jgi:sortase A